MKQATPATLEKVLLGRSGLLVSPIGFGTYRIEEDNALHLDALRLALSRGCNLIDTSTNYGGGGSERAIGAVIREHGRGSVVLVSKAGYVQGPALERAKAREAEGRPFPEMTKFNPGLWHCLSPEFLEDQLTGTLQRLGVEKLDVLLLHNPEYFLKASPDQTEYLARIERAFRHLESEVKRGRISHYGISSNTFPSPASDPTHTSLEAVWKLAERISPEHHFSVIQFPFNLFETGAALEKNQSGGRTLLDFAESVGLGTLVNRPLNAFSGNRLIRLADFPEHDEEGLQKRLNQSLEATMGLEARFPRSAGVPLRECPTWGHILDDNVERLSDLDTWRQALEYQILPSLAEALPRLEGKPELAEWARQYRESSAMLFDSFTAYLETLAAAVSGRIKHVLDDAAPELIETPSLSRKAVRVLRSCPGIHSVLVGMRRPEYVRDSLSSDPLLSPDRARAALEAMHRMQTQDACT